MSFRSLKNEPTEPKNEPNDENNVLVYNAKKSTFEENTVQRNPGRGRHSTLSPPGGIEILA